MKIRYGAVSDIESCVVLGQKLHAVTRFASYQYQPQRVAQQLSALIVKGQNIKGSHCMLIAEDSAGVIVGCLIGCVECHLFSDQLVASIAHYLVLPERRLSGAGLRLLTAFRNWAQQRGAFELNAGVNSGVDMERMDRFLRRLGFRPTGGNYAMALQCPSASPS